MARVAEYRDDQNGTLTAGGTANALTISANSAFTSYSTGLMLAFKAASDNTAAATLSVNSIGAKAIRKFTDAGEAALAAGDIQDDGIFVVRYDAAANSAAGAWILQNPLTLPLGARVHVFGDTVQDAEETLRTASNVNTLRLQAGTETATSTSLLMGGPSVTGGAFVNLRGNTGLIYSWTPAAGHDFAGSVEVGSFSATGLTAGTLIDGGVINNSRDTTANTNHVRWHNPNGLVGFINTNGLATQYSTSSCFYLKQNFRDFDAGYIIDRLKVYFYDWKAGGTGHGVIAQEAFEVFPDAVSPGEGTPDDGKDYVPWSVDYSKFVPLLLKEIQSLRQNVAALNTRLALVETQRGA